MARECGSREQDFWKSIFALSSYYGAERQISGLVSITLSPERPLRDGKGLLTISCLMVGCSSASLPEAGSLCTISTRMSFLAETTPLRSGETGTRGLVRAFCKTWLRIPVRNHTLEIWGKRDKGVSLSLLQDLTEDSWQHQRK